MLKFLRWSSNWGQSVHAHFRVGGGVEVLGKTK